MQFHKEQNTLQSHQSEASTVAWKHGDVQWQLDNLQLTTDVAVVSRRFCFPWAVPPERAGVKLRLASQCFVPETFDRTLNNKQATPVDQCFGTRCMLYIYNVRQMYFCKKVLLNEAQLGSLAALRLQSSVSEQWTTIACQMPI